MKIINARINTLSIHKKNVMQHSEANIAAIMKSLDEFGQQKPIVIGKGNMVVAGNGTLEAAKRLGWKTIKAIRTDLKGPAELAYMIADNNTSDMHEWDRQQLREVITGLDEGGYDLGKTTMTQFQIKPLMSGDGDGSEDGFIEYDEDLETEHQCPKCGYEF